MHWNNRESNSYASRYVGDLVSGATQSSLGGLPGGMGWGGTAITLGFGEAVKAFFGAVDDMVVYLWE